MCLVIFLSRNQPARLDMLQSELVTVQGRIQPQQRKALFQLFLMAGKLFRCEKKKRFRCGHVHEQLQLLESHVKLLLNMTCY